MSYSQAIRWAVCGLCLAGLWFFASTPTRLLVTGEKHTAKIVGCDSKSSKGARRNRSSGLRWSYAPIATAEDGYTATGSIYWSKKAWCENQIGRQTTLLVDASDPSTVRIHSFTQTWMVPSAFAIIALALIFAHIPAIASVGAPLFIIASIGAAAVEFGAADRVRNITGAAPAKVAADVLSEKALELCIQEAMIDEGITDKKALKRLACVDRNVGDLSKLIDLTSLETLLLHENNVSDLSPIQNLSQLRTLQLNKNSGLVSLDALAGLRNLEKLSAYSADIEDIAALATLPALRELDLSTNNIQNIEALSDLPNLEKIRLNHNPIADIHPLANKSTLRWLTLYSTGIRDISSLYGNTGLQVFGVTGHGNVPCEQISRMRDSLSSAAKVYGPDACETGERK